MNPYRQVLAALKRLAFAFHFHQLAGPSLRAAAAASYRPLLESLREHPALPVHIHVSGPTLLALPWYAPDVLDLIRHGVEAGQFELLGSTYAQSSLDATPPAAAEQQLAAHREQLERLLQARPVGFWNPGRRWTDASRALVAQGGFRYTFVEDAPALSLGEGPNPPFLVPAPARLRACVNLAIWSGQRGPLEDFLSTLPDHALLSYAEDAGAVGLWAWRHGRAPHADREHLSRLLTWLEGQGTELVHLAKALEGPAPSAPKLASTSIAPRTDQTAANFEAIARAIAAPGSPPHAGARRLLERARETLAACQIDFGVSQANAETWELARASLLFLEAAARAAALDQSDAPPRPAEGDRDRDGVPELYLQIGGELVILTPIGGRVLAWIDLESGEVHAGAALAHGLPAYRSVAHPYAGPVLEPASPGPATAAGRVEVPAREAWYAARLAGLDIERLRVVEAPLSHRPQDRQHDALRRIGVFADAVDGVLLADAFPHEIASGEVRFRTPWGVKVIRLVSGRLTAEYPPGYGGGGTVTIRCELLPDRRKRPALSAPPLRAEAGDAPIAVELASSPEAAMAMWEELPLAWVAGVSYRPPGVAPLPGIKLDLTRHP